MNRETVCVSIAEQPAQELSHSGRRAGSVVDVRPPGRPRRDAADAVALKGPRSLGIGHFDVVDYLLCLGLPLTAAEEAVLMARSVACREAFEDTTLYF